MKAGKVLNIGIYIVAINFVITLIKFVVFNIMYGVHYSAVTPLEELINFILMKINEIGIYTMVYAAVLNVGETEDLSKGQDFITDINRELRDKVDLLQNDFDAVADYSHGLEKRIEALEKK